MRSLDRFGWWLIGFAALPASEPMWEWRWPTPGEWVSYVVALVCLWRALVNYEALREELRR